MKHIKEEIHIQIFILVKIRC